MGRKSKFKSEMDGIPIRFGAAKNLFFFSIKTKVLFNGQSI